MNMMNNMNNMNSINYMNQMPNQINMNNPMFNQMNNQFNQNNIQMPMQMNFNFINPYQRIIELENIIKQKDIEIENLKSLLKLQKNDLTQILYDEFGTFKLKYKFIPLESPEKEIEFEDITYNCEPTINVKKRIAKKLNKNLNYLYFIQDNMEFPIFNHQSLRFFKGRTITIKELKDKKGATQEIKEEDNTKSDDILDDDSKKMTINLFFKTTQGVEKILFASRNTPIGIILIFYLLREKGANFVMDIIKKKDRRICFLYHATPLRIDDDRKIREIFGENLTPRILVNDVDNIIGG